jgi:acetylornithine deacetylase/succinyl-diaminopimelate desuccinylase-like protein
MLRFLSLAIVPFACIAAANMPPEADQKLARDIFKEVIEIKSGFTTGATTPVVEAIAKRLRAAGFSSADMFLGGAIPTKANLVVRYRGTGKRKPLLLLAHTDVVEAKREDWSVDPFTFLEKDGYYYGRGSSDDKAQVTAWVENLIRYRREGFQPDRDLIVALTADEEGGGPYNGVDWLIKNHRDLIDAEFALNEGGRGSMVNGKRLSNDMQAAWPARWCG